VMKVSNLHPIYNASRSRSRSGMEWTDFLDAMTSIGAIGVKRSETERYVVGHFNYTLAADPQFDEDDVVCIHPLFSNQFGHSYEKIDRVNKPIYPYGTGVEDDENDDYRDYLPD